MSEERPPISRRTFVLMGATLGAGIIAAKNPLTKLVNRHTMKNEVFIGRAEEYSLEVEKILETGFKELGLALSEVKGKNILIKPNLVEPHAEANQINTHIRIVHATAEILLSMGAASILVGEGPGHRRDGFLVFDEAGYIDILKNNRIRFIDLNHDALVPVPNIGHQTRMKELVFPRSLMNADMVISIAKMKTHHWTGVTLSMKNLFGLMPGSVYGWPKNVLHHHGIPGSILDITATLKPHFAIIDGIVGMEGDGPIMGTPKKAGVIVMGRNLPAVDATAARIMCIDPHQISYLQKTDGWLTSLNENNIEQRGETIQTVQTSFDLLPYIEAQRNIRLKT